MRDRRIEKIYVSLFYFFVSLTAILYEILLHSLKSYYLIKTAIISNSVPYMYFNAFFF